MTRKRDIKLVDAITKKLRLSMAQRRLLHRDITGRRLSFREIEEIAREIKQDFPNK
jgi:hypothetical protein